MIKSFVRDYSFTLSLDNFIWLIIEDNICTGEILLLTFRLSGLSAYPTSQLGGKNEWTYKKKKYRVNCCAEFSILNVDASIGL